MLAVETGLTDPEEALADVEVEEAESAAVESVEVAHPPSANTLTSAIEAMPASRRRRGDVEVEIVMTRVSAPRLWRSCVLSVPSRRLASGTARRQRRSPRRATTAAVLCQATMPCGSMTYFLADPASNSW
ncbi:hypothetical protein GCM10009719_25620 [Nocardioides kribbensis]